METKHPLSNSKETNVRITVDVPESLYKKMKIELIEKRMTIRQFFLEFLDKELEKPLT